jgi:hypothetical protein
MSQDEHPMVYSGIKQNRSIDRGFGNLGLVNTSFSMATKKLKDYSAEKRLDQGLCGKYDQRLR